jgi:hypothetical protein
VANIFTNDSRLYNDSRKDAKLAKKNLCALGVFAYMDVGEGREQDAEAWREKIIFSCFASLRLGLAANSPRALFSNFTSGTHSSDTTFRTSLRS